MVTSLFSFVAACWSWLPLQVVGLFGVFIFITCADAILGVWDRFMRVIGR